MIDLNLNYQQQIRHFYGKGSYKGFSESLKMKDFSMMMYISVYPTGSRPARMYGLPKLHKMSDSVPSLRPILTSTGTYNY